MTPAPSAPSTGPRLLPLLRMCGPPLLPLLPAGEDQAAPAPSASSIRPPLLPLLRACVLAEAPLLRPLGRHTCVAGAPLLGVGCFVSPDLSGAAGFPYCIGFGFPYCFSFSSVSCCPEPRARRPEVRLPDLLPRPADLLRADCSPPPPSSRVVGSAPEAVTRDEALEATAAHFRRCHRPLRSSSPPLFLASAATLVSGRHRCLVLCLSSSCFSAVLASATSLVWYLVSADLRL